MKRNIFISIFILFFIFSAFVPSYVFAAGWFRPTASAISLPTSLVVPGNAVVGSILWTSSPVTSQLRDGAVLDDNNTIWASVNNGTLAPGFTDVFQTNISGLGIKWWGTWKARNFPGGLTMPIVDPSTFSPGPTGWKNGDTYPQTIWVELIKIGPIEKGTLSVQTTTTMRFNCQLGGCQNWGVSVSNTSTVLAGPTCTVSTPAIPVSMGNIATTIFTGMGTTSPPRPFTITLACSGGEQGTAISSYVTLTDVSRPDNTSTTLSLTSASTASGLGIHILKEDVVLGYGPDSSSAGNINQWKAGTIAQGVSVFQIPLSARYVQIAPNVSPGSANGLATFTMSYQ
ncbi:Pilin (type 1 fimbria component protein) [Pseudomonas sp. NFPP07]|uniref:fimbrial protein n=1 Tax=Pseudomonas sp. NFPP07 TaxID=1566213 RepID=UPI0008EEA7D6|nr:fimbrial protein [Pseudomonas sp. NFPP07]SFP34431.1 Pilin (type 1 fimbria component protein) [Pseudomonas sp. NFPP07]